jgi:hypothetical protein
MPISALATSMSKRTLTAALAAGDLQASRPSETRSVGCPPSLGSFRRRSPVWGYPRMWRNSKTRTAGTSSHSMVPSTAIESRTLCWLPRTRRGRWKAFARSSDRGQWSNSSASIWSATCARTRCPTCSGNYLRPRHDNKRLTNSAQLMEPDRCPSAIYSDGGHFHAYLSKTLS